MKMLHQRKRAELLYMAEHRCEHRHTFIEHPQCYRDGRKERLGFLDIETSNLDADYGIILTWAILDSQTGKVEHDQINLDDIKKGRDGSEDKRVTKTLLEALQKYDRIVTFYGVRFDVPYIRTRSLVNKLSFPLPGAIKHTDIYFTARHKLKLSRNGLENVSRTLIGKTDKTRLLGVEWRYGARGDKKALSFILDHNIRDVHDTKKVYDVLMPYMRLLDTSA